jgi:hypothetical protein
VPAPLTLTAFIAKWWKSADGWSWPLTDEEILEQLLTLSEDRGSGTQFG